MGKLEVPIEGVNRNISGGRVAIEGVNRKLSKVLAVQGGIVRQVWNAYTPWSWSGRVGLGDYTAYPTYDPDTYPDSGQRSQSYVGTSGAFNNSISNLIANVREAYENGYTKMRLTGRIYAKSRENWGGRLAIRAHMWLSLSGNFNDNSADLGYVEDYGEGTVFTDFNTVLTLPSLAAVNNLTSYPRTCFSTYYKSQYWDSSEYYGSDCGASLYSIQMEQ